MPDLTVHQLKISLQGATPPLWRRIQVPSGASLGFLHDVIQVAFGWEGFHLHLFRDGRDREWGEPPMGDDMYPSLSRADEEEAELGKILRVEGTTLEYEYDFGDSWTHRIETERILPLDPGVAYPRCTDGRRAAPPAEDIGGIWGLEHLAHLVTHPEQEPPEHLEDLVGHLRERGYDPAAFDPVELTARLSRLSVRTAASPVRTRKRTRQVQRLTSEDLEFCTCGQCQAGDPVRSVAGGYLTEEVTGAPEVFPAITLPPRAELAECARRVPRFDDASRLAGWCASGRQVTPKGVLRPALARQAVEELRLWERDDQLADPDVRADTLAGFRSAGDIAVLDSPWQFAIGNGFIMIRSGKAVPGPGLPDSGDADQVLSCWQAAFEEDLGTLDDMGGRVLPGMLSMIGGQFGSVIFPLIELLYRLPDEQWLDSGTLMSSLGTGSDDATSMAGVFLLESAARLMRILADSGAADVDWGSGQWRGGDAGAMMLFGMSLPDPGYRMRLTPLGRHGIRTILVNDGHTARLTGELATADAVTFLGAFPDFSPAELSTEVAGWLAARDETSAVTQLLEAVTGTDPDLAASRVAAIAVLTELKPDDARPILRDAAAAGPGGRRHVAAGALARLGEEPPGYRETIQQWLIVDALTALSEGDLRENLTKDLMDLISSHADDLWRCEHPAAADAIDAAATAVRDTDKATAKRLRRSAHKARSRQ